MRGRFDTSDDGYRSVATRDVFTRVTDTAWLYGQLRDLRRVDRRRQRVPVKDLIATQETLSAQIVRSKRPGLDRTPLPEVVLLDGGYYITEGHHRIAYAIDSGARDVEVIVEEYR